MIGGYVKGIEIIHAARYWLTSSVLATKFGSEINFLFDLYRDCSESSF